MRRSPTLLFALLVGLLGAAIMGCTPQPIPDDDDVEPPDADNGLDVSCQDSPRVVEPFLTYFAELEEITID